MPSDGQREPPRPGRSHRHGAADAMHKVATPANWKPGDDVIIAGSVSDEEARKIYPQGWKAPLPYLRLVPDPIA
jgi:hypothetical protein